MTFSHGTWSEMDLSAYLKRENTLKFQYGSSVKFLKFLDFDNDLARS